MVAPGVDRILARRPTATAAAPTPAPRQSYRALTILGLTTVEAENLTAVMCGIPLDGAHWSLRQINYLLFLRELRRTGRFGRTDGWTQHST
jgi:hypothetical protein